MVWAFDVSCKEGVDISLGMIVVCLIEKIVSFIHIISGNMIAPIVKDVQGPAIKTLAQI